MGKFGVFALVVAMALAGCADTSAPPETALAPAVKQGANLGAAPVALVSLQGAPEGPANDFEAALKRELGARGVAMAPPKTARYLLRGYLAARPEPGGADFSYLFDVYDRHQARAARLDAAFAVKGEADPWSLMDAKAIDGLAVQSADDIAAWVSQTPEATPTLSYAQ